MKLFRKILKAFLVIVISYIFIGIFLWYFDFGPRHIRNITVCRSIWRAKQIGVFIDEYYGIDTLRYKGGSLSIDWAMTHYFYSYNDYWSNKIGIKKYLWPQVVVKFHKDFDERWMKEMSPDIWWKFEDRRGDTFNSRMVSFDGILDFDFRSLKLPADTFHLYLVEYEYQLDETGSVVRDSLGSHYSRYDTIGSLTLVKKQNVSH